MELTLALTVGPIQLPITSSGVPAHHLYEHLCPLHHAGDHGPEPEWVRHPMSFSSAQLTSERVNLANSRQFLWHILEMRTDWRTAQPVRQYLLHGDGCKFAPDTTAERDDPQLTGF